MCLVSLLLFLILHVLSHLGEIKQIERKELRWLRKKHTLLKSNNQRQSTDNIPEEVNEFSRLRVQLGVQRSVAFIYANNKSVDAVNYNGNEPTM